MKFFPNSQRKCLHALIATLFAVFIFSCSRLDVDELPAPVTSVAGISSSSGYDGGSSSSLDGLSSINDDSSSSNENDGESSSSNGGSSSSGENSGESSSSNYSSSSSSENGGISSSSNYSSSSSSENGGISSSSNYSSSSSSENSGTSSSSNYSSSSSSENGGISSSYFSSSSVDLGDCPAHDPDEQFCDIRDNNIYKFVEIGDQTWMAENLNYETESGSTCYYDCATYGRVYDWATAMLELCPSGWHLPTNAEWENLVNYIEITDGKGSNTAGIHLKATSGWVGCYPSGNMYKCEDTYGFAALSSGQNVNSTGYTGNWWSANEADYNNSAYHLNMLNNYDGVYFNTSGKNVLYSVRCIKDD